MGNKEFEVTVIREGRETDYQDFWVRHLTENAVGVRLHSDLVGFTVIVEAGNLNDAIAVTRKRYPSNAIDSQSAKRIR